MGWPMERYKEVVVKIKMLCWSSIGAEQGHTAAAVIHKQHPEMQDNMLTCRSYLYQVRPLFNMAEDEKEVLKIQRQIDQMEANNLST